MLTSPPKISEQAGQIRDWLQSYIAEKGGVAVVASNFRDMWEQASNNDDRPRILICYAGEASRGDFSVANKNHRVDREWNVLVTKGRGFNAIRGDGLTESSGNTDPFYDNVEDVREMLRRMTGISEEFPIDYRSIRPVQMGQLTIDGYLITFSTANDIPAILTQPPAE